MGTQSVLLRAVVPLLAGAFALAGCSEGKAVRDLAITQKGPEHIRPGSEVVYEVTIVNQGRHPAHDVVVDNRTPAGMRFLFNKGNCSTSYPCTMGTLKPGKVRKITTHMSIPVTYPGLLDIVHEVIVSGSFPGPEEGQVMSDGVPRNNRSVIKTPVMLEDPNAKKKRGRRR